MEGIYQGFKVSTENFERLINSTKKILKKVDKILELLVISSHNIITKVITSIIAISSTLGLIPTIYIIRLKRSLRPEEEGAVKIAKELCERWDKLETVIRSQAQENSQPRTKQQLAIFECIPVSMDNSHIYRVL